MRGIAIDHRARNLGFQILLLMVLVLSPGPGVVLDDRAAGRLLGQVPNLTFVELFHVNAEEVIQFLRGIPELEVFVENGTVQPIANRPQSLLVSADPAATEALVRTIREFENLEVRDRLVERAISIRYGVARCRQGLSGLSPHRGGDHRLDQAGESNHHTYLQEGTVLSI